MPILPWKRRKKALKSFVQPAFWENRNTFINSGIASFEERAGIDFDAYSQEFLKGNGVVFSCVATRQLLFSEGRFVWRRRENGRAGELFGNRELSVLERPWNGGTTGDLLAQMETDVSLAGNWYGVRSGNTIRRLRPDWVTIVIDAPSGNPWASDAYVKAYLYRPPMAASGASGGIEVFTPDEVAHYAPHPDPQARFRGMSWITPVVAELDADGQATKHKRSFFRKGASLQHVIALDKETTPEQFDAFVERFEESHQGADNAYKTLFLGGGADVKVVGTSMRDLDIKSVQASGENRIASASLIHPVILGLTDGLSGSSLNSGNFTAARRLTGDKYLRPMWRKAAACLEHLLKSPGDDAELWYDTRDVAFLRDDEKDLAQVQQNQASALYNLIISGWEPDAAVDFIRSDDLGKLIDRHSGLFSVQLQPPGTEMKPPSARDTAVVTAPGEGANEDEAS